jgi:hypothetical protein
MHFFSASLVKLACNAGLLYSLEYVVMTALLFKCLHFFKCAQDDNCFINLPQKGKVNK